MDTYNYAWCRPWIRAAAVTSIYELGSRDCEDAIRLAQEYQCVVTAFECNPDCIRACRLTLDAEKNKKKQGGNSVRLVEQAVHSEDGPLHFFAFDQDKYDNIGASSVLEIDFSAACRNPSDPDYGRGSVQKKIVVDAVRLETYIDQNDLSTPPSLIVADLQENELRAFQGLGRFLDDPRLCYIVSEACITPTYKSGCSFREVSEFLGQHGFVYVASDAHGTRAPPAAAAGYHFFNALFQRV